MVDHLSLLEERVESLIQNLDRTMRANDDLRRRNAELEEDVERLQGQQATWQGEVHRLGQELEAALGTLAEAKEQSVGLQAEIQRTRTELESTSGREDLIRDRLQGILEKLDSIEQEFNVMQRAE